MNRRTEQKAKKKSAAITLIISVIVLCGLFFLSFKYYDPPIENAIAINFGYDEEGMGEEEPAPTEGVAQDDQASASEVKKTQASKVEPVKEKIVTQEKESPVVKPKAEKVQPKKKIDTKQVNKTTEQTNKTTQEPKPETQDINKATGESDKPKLDGRLGGLRGSLGGKGKTASSGDGDGSKKGNQGVLEGDPSAKNYDGSIAKGTRKLVTRPAAPDFNQCPNNEYGKLVVTYKVNASGKVISNTIGFNGKGTNITVNTCIKNILKDYLSKFKYTASSKASEATSQTFNLKPQ
ncbi:hypothetical protein UJ101_01763 [Flavobacteriaceae bacterium UJ101]|nr:hypothetical protein UJ101_01763 [Flavobacteriaceae bacterium UJ101]